MQNRFGLDLSSLARFFFSSVATKFGKIRFLIGMWILPKDVSNFTILILSKIVDDIQKLDKDKRDKITSLKIDFEFRD